MAQNHHDFAHHPQWHLKLLPDATVEVTTPAGRVLTGRAPPTAPLRRAEGVPQTLQEGRLVPSP